MTPAEQRFFDRAMRRLAGLQPELRAAILRAFQIIRDALDDAALEKLIANGQLDQLFSEVLKQELLDRAMLPVRQRVRSTLERGFAYAAKDLPGSGKVDGEIAVAFDHLSPRVVDAIRQLESVAIDRLKDDVRDVVRAHIENGLRDGRAPKAVARELRSMIGLGTKQEEYVRNLRTELETGNYADAAERQLIDRRFNLAKLDALSPADRAARIDRIVDAYSKSFVAFNAETNAKTLTFDGYRLGQQLAWQDASDNGVIPPGFEATKTWVHLDGQANPRPHHEAMDGETVAADQPYSNRDTRAGESDPWNCHCLDRFGIRRVA